MKILTILSPVFFCCFSVQAQESLNAGGGDISESDLTIAYSIGQVFSEPIVYAEGSLTPGIQQAYEITLVSALPEMNVDLQIRAYPNPVDDYLLLSFPEYGKAVHTLRLIDASGKNVYMDEVKEELSRLEIRGLTPGTYFLQIANNEQIIQLFKIIKK